MRTMLLCLLVTLVTASMASATVAWVEDWESYTSGVTPYDSWILGNGVWEPLTGGGQAMGNQAYRIVGGSTSRIGKALGFNAADQTSVVLEGWFYDTNGATSMKRSWLGFQQDFAVNNALVRIGMNNVATYQVHYWDGGALKTVDTGLGNQAGWHYVKLEMVKNPTDWTCNWQINAADGTPYTGSFTWGWLAESANNAVVGYNYSCTAEIDWDDISLSYTPVPEPGSILALCTGLVGLIGIRRRMA